jgi:hypothetical protein
MADREFDPRDRNYAGDERDYGRGDFRARGREGGYGGGPMDAQRGDYSDYGEFRGYGAYGEHRGFGGTSGFGDRQGTAVGRPNYAGRGPKNWRRSDERITEEINERLARDPDLDATDVEVRVENGLVTLSGVVEDRGAKRRAEDLAEDAFGVDDVHNELKIRHGLLSRLTGEHADERDVTRGAERDRSSTTTRGAAAAPSRGTNARSTARR